MEALLASLLMLSAVGQVPDITFWYGTDQFFGELGNPQNQINILGNVQAPEGLVDLIYRLDGGPPQPLSFGPDSRRLLNPGDFNVELFLDQLAPGPHDLIVRATDAEGNIRSETIDFSIDSNSVWPLPYTADWSNASEITDAAQPVDGLWIITPEGVRCPDVGYDRILAIGDRTWTNYEVRVPITIHSVDPAGYEPPSGTPGLGLVMRWPGHSDFLEPGSQPSVGYWPLGGVGEFVYHLDGCGSRLQLYGNQFVLRDEECINLDFGVTYIWKMRVQTMSNGKHVYKLKVWQQGTSEPAGWTLSMVEEAFQPAQGSLLLLAHHVDVTFGDVQVTLPGGDPAPPPPPDEVLVRSRAQLFGDPATTGKVIYRELMLEGELARRFNATVFDAAPGQMFAIHLNGAFVASMQADQFGEATLEMRTPNFISDPSHQPMPGNFPTITDLETIAVGPLSGVFFDAAYTLPEGEDLIGPQYKISNNFIDGVTGMTGSILYRERIKNGALDRRLFIQAENGEPGSFRWFRIDDQKVAQLFFDAAGNGYLEIRSPAFITDHGVQVPMGQSFPTLLPNEVVRIGHIHVQLTE